MIGPSAHQHLYDHRCLPLSCPPTSAVSRLLVTLCGRSTSISEVAGYLRHRTY